MRNKCVFLLLAFLGLVSAQAAPTPDSVNVSNHEEGGQEGASPQHNQEGNRAPSPPGWGPFTIAAVGSSGSVHEWLRDGRSSSRESEQCEPAMGSQTASGSSYQGPVETCQSDGISMLEEITEKLRGILQGGFSDEKIPLIQQVAQEYGVQVLVLKQQESGELEQILSLEAEKSMRAEVTIFQSGELRIERYDLFQLAK